MLKKLAVFGSSVAPCEGTQHGVHERGTDRAFNLSLEHSTRPHRLGSALNPHVHFHRVVIGVFDPAGGVVFKEATGFDESLRRRVGARPSEWPLWGQCL
jgi:hypothetical protein